MSIVIIKEAIENFAPRANAMSWDNTGILIESENKDAGKDILLTIDLTEEVLEECIEKSIHFIVAYHPIIFIPLKKLTDKRLTRCIVNGISVYCPHTQLDSLMNEYLRNILGKNITMDDVIRVLKKTCGLETIRIVRASKDVTYANDGDIVVGVGAAFRDPDFKNTLLITGEMSHHDMLKCKRNQTAVILLEHSNSERPFLKELKRLMENEPSMKEYKINISKEDKDPVEFI